VASGVLTNRSGAPHGFAVIVRFLDGDVDLGPPQIDIGDAVTAN
jgi:hypothetical protein